ncbi:hypothetical protein ABMA27_009791 [Loxostege sticticalis]|uniref:Peptidase S1 domain-containing protein n=1 Tax=Loxostege sticticalis TaxID=481309 RepID=A0ABR3H6H7_LOXSC
MGAPLKYFILSFSIFAKPTLPTKNAKIVGGHDIDITDAPYQVSVHHIGNYVSGGTLVKKDIVLATAYSFYLYAQYPSHYKVRVGSSIIDDGGVLHEVEKIVTHPLHGQSTHNIAVAKLSMPVTLSDKVAVIPMMEPGEEVPAGKTVQLTGWGATEWDTYPFEYPIMLQKLEVTAVDYDTCVYEYDPDVFSPDMMCAANPSNKGYNWGDAGSPVVFNGKLAAICNDNIYIPSGPVHLQDYVKVSAHRRWIDETIQNITSHF